MKYLVLINKIIENKNAGRYKMPPFGKTNVSICFDVLPRELKYLITDDNVESLLNDDLCVAQYSFDGFDFTDVKFICGGQSSKWIKYFLKYNIKIKQNRDIIDIYMMPESNYYMSYNDIKVECSECKKKFSRFILETYEDDHYYNTEVCPFCGELSCCELEYEKIDDAIIRGVKINEK